MWLISSSPVCSLPFRGQHPICARQFRPRAPTGEPCKNLGAVSSSVDFLGGMLNEFSSGLNNLRFRAHPSQWNSRTDTRRPWGKLNKRFIAEETAVELCRFRHSHRCYLPLQRLYCRESRHLWSHRDGSAPIFSFTYSKSGVLRHDELASGDEHYSGEDFSLRDETIWGHSR